MTEPLAEFSRASTNRTLAPATEAVEHDAALRVEADDDIEPADESPPGTPRWVKVLGIALVMLLLAFAGLHLTGNVPMHMAGESGVHGMPLP